MRRRARNRPAGARCSVRPSCARRPSDSITLPPGQPMPDARGGQAVACGADERCSVNASALSADAREGCENCRRRSRPSRATCATLRSGAAQVVSRDRVDRSGHGAGTLCLTVLRVIPARWSTSPPLRRHIARHGRPPAPRVMPPRLLRDPGVANSDRRRARAAVWPSPCPVSLARSRSSPILNGIPARAGHDARRPLTLGTASPRATMWQLAHAAANRGESHHRWLGNHALAGDGGAQLFPFRASAPPRIWAPRPWDPAV